MRDGWKFDKDAARTVFNLLHGIAKCPPSEEFVSTEILKQIIEFTRADKTSKEILDFCKNIHGNASDKKSMSYAFAYLFDLSCYEEPHWK